jgi:hypothetical protein
MIDLPFNADALGECMLSSYLRADPGRLSVLKSIIHHLDDDGRVGDAARFYIVQNAYRRAVLRGVLIALNIKLPPWAYETAQAGAANRAFIQGYREEYNLHRREKRQRANNPTARLVSQALGHQRAPAAAAIH